MGRRRLGPKLQSRPNAGISVIAQTKFLKGKLAAVEVRAGIRKLVSTTIVITTVPAFLHCNASPALRVADALSPLPPTHQPESIPRCACAFLLDASIPSAATPPPKWSSSPRSLTSTSRRASAAPRRTRRRTSPTPTRKSPTSPTTTRQASPSPSACTRCATLSRPRRAPPSPTPPRPPRTRSSPSSASAARRYGSSPPRPSCWACRGLWPGLRSSKSWRWRRR